MPGKGRYSGPVAAPSGLVAAVRGSAAHEEETLQQVVRERAAAMGVTVTDEDLANPKRMAAFAKAQDELRLATGQVRWGGFSSGCSRC